MSKHPVGEQPLFHFQATSDDCIKCGKCIPVCTIHQVHPDEATSPRGFIDLLGAYERGDLELDKNAKNIFETCFLCTNCTDVCPNSLPTDMVIEQVRADIAQKFGLAWFKRLFFGLLRNRTIMDMAMKLGGIFAPLALKGGQGKGKMILRLPIKLPYLGKNRALPPVSVTSFLNRHEENIHYGGERKVAVFAGCLANYNYAGIGESLLQILKELQIDAFLAKKQLCCGAPAYFTGDFKTVDQLVKHNIEYFEEWIDEVEAVLVPEATCSAMIKADWEHFLHDQPEWKDRATKLKSKIFMATDWLHKETDLEKVLAQKESIAQKITYHDPCHARKVQGVFKEPRALLSQNYDLVEMSDPNRCCGFGGVTIQSEKFELAQKAGAPKANMIEETGAEVVSAECSACRIQLTNALHQNGVEVEFKHPLELIAQALR